MSPRQFDVQGGICLYQAYAPLLKNVELNIYEYVDCKKNYNFYANKPIGASPLCILIVRVE